MTNVIGTLNEQPLHATLKQFYAGETGEVERKVDGYIVDVCKGNQLIEIQTQHFSSIKNKIFELTRNHEVLLVYPIASEKWLLKLPGRDGDPIERRKSPKRGKSHEIFYELVSMPEMLQYKNFSIEIALVDVEEVRQYSSKKPWVQNGWLTIEQRLIRVVNRITLKNPIDLVEFLPETLPDKFTTHDITKIGALPRELSQKIAYCMRKAGIIQNVGKQGRSILYQIKQPGAD